MYSRQKERTFTIPQNYSGNAFSDTREPEREEHELAVVDQSSVERTTESHSVEPKKFLPINIGSEELILIGIAILLFQSDKNDGIIPLLLAILLLG